MINNNSQLSVNSQHLKSPDNRDTTQIWETLMSTYRNICVSKIYKADRPGIWFDRNSDVSSSSILSYDSANPLFFQKQKI